ncbi:glycosyl hydrolase family 8 [Oceanobacillus kapialis]|uniref:glycosyl hydrolase family 8 n=1 Tax=Oceanobacillus kapialis TaxID=481353 RepID=UPI00384F5D7A
MLIPLFIVIILILIVINVVINVKGKRSNASYLITERFIEKHLINANGTLTTSIKPSGQEVLSESIGFWMRYAVEKKDKNQFDHAYVQLVKHFLKQDGMVYWKIADNGKCLDFANNLVDDLRIISALLDAGEHWPDSPYPYRKTAEQMTMFVKSYNRCKDVLIDFYDKGMRYHSNYLTLSSVEVEALGKMRNKGLISNLIYESTVKKLLQAPLKDGFFPKSYHTLSEQYIYEKEVDMTEQALTAYQLTLTGRGPEAFLTFVKKEFLHKRKIYVRYNRGTKVPTVYEESPAVYSILILCFKEIGDREFVNKLFRRLLDLRNMKAEDPYYGGYAVSQQKAHLIDNLLPLLAERKLSSTN